MGIDKAYVQARIQIDPATGCWNWLLLKNKDGHAMGMNWAQMHRVVKTLYEGHVFQPGEVADHLCRNTGCINPAHIRVTTKSINNRHGSDARAGTMAKRRLRVARYMHDTLPQRYEKKVKDAFL